MKVQTSGVPLALWFLFSLFCAFCVAEIHPFDDIVGNSYTRTCNKQGIVYSDSDYSNCECFQCFHGPSCEYENENCNVNVAGGNPSLAQEYWERITEPVGLTVSEAYYRSPYELHSGLIPPQPASAAGIDQYLRNSIIQIHELAQNAETDGYFIVYGQGGTQMINAAAYALGSVANKPLPVFAKAPYYSQYKAWADFNTLNNYWNASTEQSDKAEEIIEFVTSPNNPDGTLRTPFYNTSKNLVYDMVYYWPTWTEVEEKAGHEIMLFSLSKLSGHAGTRFGWALVKDKKVAETMRSFINLVNIHTSMDTVHRAIHILDAMANGIFFHDMAQVMKQRYHEITPLFDNQQRFSLELPSTSDSWFYLWVKCEQEDDCYQTFLNAQIIGEKGTLFGVSSQYIRIQLTVRSVNYKLFLDRLQELLSSK